MCRRCVAPVSPRCRPRVADIKNAVGWPEAFSERRRKINKKHGPEIAFFWILANLGI